MKRTDVEIMDFQGDTKVMFVFSHLFCLLLPNFCLPCLWGKYSSSASLFWPLITRLFSTIGIQLYITTVSPQVVEFWDGREQV